MVCIDRTHFYGKLRSHRQALGTQTAEQIYRMDKAAILRTKNMKHELHRFLEIEKELKDKYAERNAVSRIIEPLERERDAILKRWGNSGRTFDVGGVLLQANKSNEYPSLYRITPESVDGAEW